MFAARYWAPRYWAPRYWPKAGGASTAAPRRLATVLAARATLATILAARATRATVEVGGPVAINTTLADVYQGEDVVLPIEVAEPVTGWSLRFTIRNKAGTELIAKTIGSGIAVIDDETAGGKAEVEVTLPTADTDLLTPDTYRWALYRSDAGSHRLLGYGYVPIPFPRAAGP